MKLLIDESIYKSKEISIYGLATYCAIKTLLQNKDIQQICISNELLCYQLLRSFNSSRRFKENIKDGYNELLSKNIIKITESSGKYDAIDCTNIFSSNPDDHFTIIDYEEIIKIFQIESGNSFMLLKYFIFLSGSVSSKIKVSIDNINYRSRVVGFFSIEYMSNISDISQCSIMEYNKLLEENKLIYVHRQNDFIVGDDKNISRLKNVYGRYVDKDYIIAYANQQKKKKKAYRYVENDLNETNSKRRFAQIYVQIAKGNDAKYSEKTITDVFNYVLQENKKYNNICKKRNDTYYKSKIRDTDVFKKYEFIKMEEFN